VNENNFGKINFFVDILIFFIHLINGKIIYRNIEYVLDKNGIITKDDN